MSIQRSYKGSCFCGAVEFTVSGEPAAMGYCPVSYTHLTLPTICSV